MKKRAIWLSSKIILIKNVKIRCIDTMYDTKAAGLVPKYTNIYFDNTDNKKSFVLYFEENNLEEYLVGKNKVFLIVKKRNTRTKVEVDYANKE